MAYKDIEARRLNDRKYYERNKEKRRESKRIAMQKYRETDIGRKANVNAVKKYFDKNIGFRNALAASYRASKLLRTPRWLSQLDINNIQLFYDAATALSKELGVMFHVDHIVPLKGKNVSGLHVPWNLQVIPAMENYRKGNKY